mmetsp:Transcript_52137/g.113717  ORF Transcript_52137/g.113717 Transcript_52137/m.113717 type:complete len:334 (-) Transcript_52137:385-1386(-)
MSVSRLSCSSNPAMARHASAGVPVVPTVASPVPCRAETLQPAAAAAARTASFVPSSTAGLGLPPAAADAVATGASSETGTLAAMRGSPVANITCTVAVPLGFKPTWPRKASPSFNSLPMKNKRGRMPSPGANAPRLRASKSKTLLQVVNSLMTYALVCPLTVLWIRTLKASSSGAGSSETVGGSFTAFTSSFFASSTSCFTCAPTGVNITCRQTLLEMPRESKLSVRVLSSFPLKKIRTLEPAASGNAIETSACSCSTFDSPFTSTLRTWEVPLSVPLARKARVDGGTGGTGGTGLGTSSLGLGALCVLDKSFLAGPWLLRALAGVGVASGLG